MSKKYTYVDATGSDEKIRSREELLLKMGEINNGQIDLSLAENQDVMNKLNEAMEIIKNKAAIGTTKQIIDNRYNLSTITNKFIKNKTNTPNELIKKYESHVDNINSDLEKLQYTKNQLIKCIDCLSGSSENENSQQFPNLELFINTESIGKLQDVEYDDIINDNGTHTLMVNLNSVKSKINYHSGGKRSISLKMNNNESLSKYQIKFDLDKINAETNSVKGSYFVSK